MAASVIIAGGAARAASAAPHPPAGRLVTVPALPYPVYLVPVPRDDRPPRQRCRDTAIARLGHPASDLDLRVIDLQCSQR